MPIGAKTRVVATGPHTPPRLVPMRTSASGQPLGVMWTPESGVPADPGLWDHKTITGAAAAAGAQLTFPQQVSRIRILERSGVVIYVGLGRTPGAGIGAYDLVHPGSAELEYSIPPTSVIGLLAVSAPADPIEVFGLAGWYAERPV